MSGKRIANLATIEGCQHEMARLYREARRHEIDLAECKGLVWVLKNISSLVVEGDLERRITELEDRV